MSSTRELLMQLHQQHSGALQAHLQRLLGDRAQAQDLTQQAGLKLLELPTEQFHALREPRAFLFQIATNLARDVLRRRSSADAATIELSRSASSTVPDPETLASVSQQLARVQAAIATLPNQARSVLLLARVDGLSHKQIALRLGLQPKTVENYLARALAGLAQRLSEHDHGH